MTLTFELDLVNVTLKYVRQLKGQLFEKSRCLDYGSTGTHGPDRMLCLDHWWLGSLVVRASDLRLTGHKFDPGRRTVGRMVQGWMTVFGRAYYVDM